MKKQNIRVPGTFSLYDPALGTLASWMSNQSFLRSRWIGAYGGSEDKDIHFGETYLKVVYVGRSGLNTKDLLTI